MPMGFIDLYSSIRITLSRAPFVHNTAYKNKLFSHDTEYRYMKITGDGIIYNLSHLDGGLCTIIIYIKNDSSSVYNSKTY